MGKPELPPVNSPPRLEGSTARSASVDEAGSWSVSVRMTRNTTTKVVIAAAVFRSNAPNARAAMPATVTYNAAPTTYRSAASDSDELSWSPSSA